MENMLLDHSSTPCEIEAVCYLNRVGLCARWQTRKTRILGKIGLQLSALGLGCMGMSFGFGSPENKQEMLAGESRRHLALISKEAYGPFLNEDLVGVVLLHDEIRW